jgi:hypothetical protein
MKARGIAADDSLAIQVTVGARQKLAQLLTLLSPLPNQIRRGILNKLSV